MAQPADRPQSTFGGWLGSMWMYTVLRFALFLALWGIVVLLGLHGLFAALVALVLSVPLSFVLLARPRARLVHQLELRAETRKQVRARLDADLDPRAGTDSN